MSLSNFLSDEFGDAFEEEFKLYPWFRDLHPYQSGDQEVFIATLKKAGFEKAIAADIKNPALERMKKRTPYGARKADPILLALIDANKDDVFKYFLKHGHFVHDGNWIHVRKFFTTRKIVKSKAAKP